MDLPIGVACDRFSRLAPRVFRPVAIQISAKLRHLTSVPSPSRRTIEAALFGLRKDAPFTDADLDKHFALLCLPILGQETDAARRLELFREVLRLGIADLEPRFRPMATHLLLPKADVLLGDRTKAAMQEMQDSNPDWVEDFKPETLERRALAALATLLISDEFTNAHAGSLDFTSTPSPTEDLLGYRWIKARQELQIPADDPHLFIWRHRFEIEATRNNLKFFTYEYHWSGNQDERPKPRLLGNDSRQTHLGICAEAQVGTDWQVHVVHLGRALARGQIITVAFETSLRDDTGVSEPYNVLVPRVGKVEELEFICRFPDSRGEKMRCATWDLGALTAVEHPIEPLNPQADGSYSHPFKTPKCGIGYGIAWG
jgi:hypothetical protein